MAERTLVIIAALLFIAGNVYAEWRNRKTMVWWHNPLSAYLVGVPGSNVQDAAYLIFAVGLVLFGVLLGDFWYILMGCVAAAALYLVVITRIAIAEAEWRIDDVKLERAHVISAGIAFISCTAMLIRHGYLIHDQWVFALAIAAPISALLFYMFEPQDTTLEEKTYCGLLLAALGIALLGA